MKQTQTGLFRGRERRKASWGPPSPSVLLPDRAAAFRPYRENGSLCPLPDHRNTFCTLPGTCLRRQSPPPAAQRLSARYTSRSEMEQPMGAGVLVLPPAPFCLYLFLRPDPLGVGGFFETLHADRVEFYHALSKRDQVQDVPKRLRECSSRTSNNWIKNTEGVYYVAGRKTLSGQLQSNSLKNKQARVLRCTFCCIRSRRASVWPCSLHCEPLCQGQPEQSPFSGRFRPKQRR